MLHMIYQFLFVFLMAIGLAWTVAASFAVIEELVHDRLDFWHDMEKRKDL